MEFLFYLGVALFFAGLAGLMGWAVDGNSASGGQHR